MRRRNIVSIHEPAALPGAGDTNATEVANRLKHKVSDNIHDLDASLARIDAIAAAALSNKPLARYESYKQVLLAREQDRSAIISTLTLFVSDLTEARSRSAAISRLRKRNVDTPTSFAAGTRPRDLVTIATQLPRQDLRPDLRAEAVASTKLSRVLASDPSTALTCVLEIARGLCHAGTAGLTLFRSDRADGITAQWELVRGALASYEGIDAMPTDSPCGLCLDAGTTILVSRPARVFAWLEDIHPAILETLIAPLVDDTGHVRGTLWIAHHEPDSRCTCEDVRILEQLAQQLMLALKLQEHAKDRERALLFKDAMIDEVNHRTKNTLQVASILLTMQANATSSMEARGALLDGHARLQLLARTHVLLCIEPNSTQTVLMPQLLRAVCDALESSFGHTCPGVRLEVSCDPMSLPADDAIAIALLSNEAITNSYKHAFANRSSGEIAVQLHGSSEHAVVLRISDSGIGAKVTDSKHGMGLKLMRLLSAQVQGTLDIASPAGAGGTTVTLKLDRTADRERVPDAIVRPIPAGETAA